jgi:hypothetical protein
MTIKQYFPLSVLAFASVVTGVHNLPFPVAPFAVILLVAETLIGFQLEDHKIPRLIAEIFRALNDQSGTLRPD